MSTTSLTINSNMMEKTKVKVRYIYHKEWREKYLTLREIAAWIGGSRYQRNVNAVRGLEVVHFLKMVCK